MERPMYAQAREGLDRLSAKLRRIQSGYEWARSRGDTDRINQYRTQLDALAAERDRLVSRESDASPVSDVFSSIANFQVEDQGVSRSASTRPVRITEVR